MLVMLGVSGEADAYTAQTDVIESVESQPSFSTDYDELESIEPGEANVFSSVSLVKHMHNVRVQVRRKCFGNAWGGLALSVTDAERRMFGGRYAANNANSINQPRKEYFISLRKFII